MSVMSIEKVTALPATFTPNTIYLVKAPGQSKVDMVFTSSDGAVNYELNGVDETIVQQIVANILTNLLNKPNGILGLNGNSEIPDAQIKSVMASPGTYPKVSVDSKGRVISGSGLSSSDIPDLDFSKIKFNKPTTLVGYGITDGISNADIVTTATANKLLKLDSNAKLPADITGSAFSASKLVAGRSIASTGDVLWSISSFDGSANVSAAAVLANSGVSAGTYNRATHIAPMTVDAKGRVTVVGTETPITPEWSNILNKPNSLTDLGLTDVVSVATPNKLLKLDSNAELPADITGNSKTATALKVARKIAMTGDVLWTVNSFDGSADVTATATLKDVGVVAGTYGNSSQFHPYEVDSKGRIVRVLPAVSFSTSWNNLSGMPTTLTGYGITDALEKTEAVAAPSPNKLLRLNSSSKLPADITGNSGTTDKLSTGRKIALGGDVVGDGVVFDGSADIVINTKVSVSGESFHPFLLFGG